MLKKLGVSIIIGSLGLVSYFYLYPFFKKKFEKNNKKIEKKNKKKSLWNLIKNVDFKEKETDYYTKKDIIKILNFIKSQSISYIEKFLKEYRKKRREFLKDDDNYRQINNELNIKLQRIITKFTKIIFDKKNINQDKFDKSIEKYQNDEEINNLLNNLCTFE